MKKVISFFAGALISVAAFAAPVSVSQTANITQTAQSFTFNFTGMSPSSGSGGVFTFAANGDFSMNFGTSESATVNFDGLGTVVMNESGVLSNSVTGLTLSSFNASNVLNYYDEPFNAVFNLSAALLDSILADGAITLIVTNGSLVDPYFAQGYPGTDPDFVSVGLNYQDRASVPEPASLALLGLGLAGLGVSRRRQK